MVGRDDFDGAYISRVDLKELMRERSCRADVVDDRDDIFDVGFTENEDDLDVHVGSKIGLGVFHKIEGAEEVGGCDDGCDGRTVVLMVS